MAAVASRLEGWFARSEREAKHQLEILVTVALTRCFRLANRHRYLLCHRIGCNSHFTLRQ
ncbi:hypothetical protein KR51_00030420 [Rubidibacter lacunae KORDI 51-2]|uniref:Transposase n=1 Tax=Rubidibacter lacunae KORDI 51-2 TaxID=582515 RepID=U5DFX1_9CHRO|nr:hypothetical protein KR51_00030420 [Rubidibacter lacunae KORDI 51-2]